ncbi:uncharacterized protein (TIGR02231 family) [Larkinella arboricola]|uniref:Uncharacterized protein (TIGR02231 family) n=1 Tax=Larkinella arboricola TaxID=643671 RepID=A0A327X4P0_LARAB|nr:DUF4139 domain-containing protein [Larkinella arboricola]RAK00043.1 uncharacterized protein (TIGR02231 family) [Larkinella arboricola]
MKTIHIFIAACLSITTTLAQDDEQRVSSSVQHVTVFLNRAQINAQARTTIGPGVTRLIIDNASAQTDPQSIQVSGKGDAMIQGVQFRTNFLTQVTKPVSLQRLEDSLRLSRETFDGLSLQKDVLENEKKMVLANQKVGSEKGTSVKEVSDMADFFRQRLTDVGKKLLALEKDLKEQKKKVDRLEGQVKEQNAKRERPVGEIEVTLTAKNRTAVDLTLSYVVNDAGWTPFYDIRVRDTKSPATLAYKANVYQNTGFDWQNVRLTLSTSNPALPGTQPQLETQFVGFYEPRPAVLVQPLRAKSAMRQPEFAGAASEAAPAADLATTANFTQVVEQPTSVIFDISVPYTVLSNNRPQVVDIQTGELPATYRYTATPKMDTDAFLVATLSGWEKLNLLNGTARTYFEGTYVGESQVSLQQAGDTLALGLGRDKKIVVKREKTEDFSSRKSLSSSVRDSYRYKITVRNTKSEAVNLTLFDQIPVSTDSRIEVELDESSGAERNAETGRLTWNLALKPGESRDLVFRYTVKYPKGKQLVNAQ